MDASSLQKGYQGLAVLSGGPSDLRRHRKALTIKAYDVATGETNIIREYLMLGKGHIAVPRSYALRRFANVCNFEAYEVDMPSARPDNDLELRQHQVDPVRQVLDAFEDNYDVILKSPTASGKTIMGSWIATELKQKTLILVDQEKLMNQWIETLEKFGYDEEEIGLVRGPTLEYEGYNFTIGMIQSIYNREFPDDFYEDFGLVIYDEYQVCGADQYSAVLSMFTAASRLGLSATDRKDDKQKIIDLHIGQHKIVVENSKSTSHVRYIEYRGNIPSWYAQISRMDGRYVSELSTDADRNELLVRAVLRLYAQGRNILVIGGRIIQLECLRSMCLMAGIPEEETVMYTGSEHIWMYRKDPKPSRRPDGWDGESEYTPVHLTLYERKVKLKQRDEQLHRSRIVFSTYSVFSKGVDVPHLDTGIDATPKATFEQIHGRILRPLPGKKIPIWVTPRDVDSFRAEKQFCERLREFSNSKVEVYLWHLDKGVQRKNLRHLLADARGNIARLKEQRVSTSADGRNISVTRSIANA